MSSRFALDDLIQQTCQVKHRTFRRFALHQLTKSADPFAKMALEKDPLGPAQGAKFDDGRLRTFDRFPITKKRKKLHFYGDMIGPLSIGLQSKGLIKACDIRHFLRSLKDVFRRVSRLTRIAVRGANVAKNPQVFVFVGFAASLFDRSGEELDLCGDSPWNIFGKFFTNAQTLSQRFKLFLGRITQRRGEKPRKAGAKREVRRAIHILSPFDFRDAHMEFESSLDRTCNAS